MTGALLISDDLFQDEEAVYRDGVIDMLQHISGNNWTTEELMRWSMMSLFQYSNHHRKQIDQNSIEDCLTTTDEN